VTLQSIDLQFRWRLLNADPSNSYSLNIFLSCLPSGNSPPIHSLSYRVRHWGWLQYWPRRILYWTSRTLRSWCEFRRGMDVLSYVFKGLAM